MHKILENVSVLDAVFFFVAKNLIHPSKLFLFLIQSFLMHGEWQHITANLVRIMLQILSMPGHYLHFLQAFQSLLVILTLTKFGIRYCLNSFKRNYAFFCFVVANFFI